MLLKIVEWGSSDDHTHSTKCLKFDKNNIIMHSYIATVAHDALSVINQTKWITINRASYILREMSLYSLATTTITCHQSTD